VLDKRLVVVFSFLPVAGCSAFAGLFGSGDDSTSPSQSTDAGSSRGEGGYYLPDGAFVPDEGGMGDPDADAIADGDVTDALDASFDGSPVAKRVFVTAESFTGDFSSSKGDPQLYADALCKASANKTGSWIAWLSVTGKPAIDRLPANVEWHLTTGKLPLVFASKAGIAAGPLVNIDVDFGGNPVNLDISDGGVPFVYTGTLASGLASGSNCNGWTTQSPAGGTAGKPDPSVIKRTEWTELITVSCVNSYRIYCFEQ
jgi:hypothetical protein